MHTFVPDFTGHHYWTAHAYCMSKMLSSPLPTDIVFIILRMVPTLSYLRAYSEPDPPLFDCERCYDACSFSDLNEPKAYGDY
jgi:hypothetical protein